MRWNTLPPRRAPRWVTYSLLEEAEESALDLVVPVVSTVPRLQGEPDAMEEYVCSQVTTGDVELRVDDGILEDGQNELYASHNQCNDEEAEGSLYKWVLPVVC